MELELQYLVLFCCVVGVCVFLLFVDARQGRALP